MKLRKTPPKLYKPDEDAVVVVCSPDYMGNPGGFDDNHHGPCVSCSEPVHWRPHNPEPSVKLCLDCAVLSIPEDEANMIEVTPETLAEFFRWLRGDAL